MSDEFEDEVEEEFDDEEEEEEHEPLRLVLGSDGKLGLAPKMVEIPEADFEKLQKALITLKKKYPKISKEIFGYE